jgi:hypothetical protein
MQGMHLDEPIRALKSEIAEAIDRARQNAEELHSIEEVLQSNLKKLKELKQRGAMLEIEHVD